MYTGPKVRSIRSVILCRARLILNEETLTCSKIEEHTHRSYQCDTINPEYHYDENAGVFWYVDNNSDVIIQGR